MQPGAQRGRHHIKQPADHRRTCTQPAQCCGFRCHLSGDGRRADNWRQGRQNIAEAEGVRQGGRPVTFLHIVEIGFRNIGLFAGQFSGQAIAQIVMGHQHAANGRIALRLMLF